MATRCFALAIVTLLATVAVTVLPAQDLFGGRGVTPGIQLSPDATEEVIDRGFATIAGYTESHDIASYGSAILDNYLESGVFLYADEDMNGLFSANNTYYFAIRLADRNGVLVDSNGDGTPDSECRTLFVPHWAVAEGSIIDPDDRQFLTDLDTMFSAFSSEEPPREEPGFAEAVQRMATAIGEATFPNRDLFYLSYLQARSHSGDGEWTLYALRTMSEQLTVRFGYEGVHPTVLIYALEHFIKQGPPEEAQRVSELALELYPDNPVFRLYNYQVNGATADEVPEELRSHWMYDQMF